MISGLFQVISFVLFILGLFFLLRATALVNRKSLLFKYYTRIGVFLVLVGGISLVMSIFL